jgi:hypothetical protein
MHGRFRRAPSWILRNSIAVPAYTIKRAITGDGQTVYDEAVSYFGFGKSGKATERLMSPAYRLGTFAIRDIQLGVSSLFGEGSFAAVDQDGEERRFGDITVAKGRIMAKVGRFRVEHWEQRMLIAKTKPNWVSCAVGAAAVMTHTLRGESHTGNYGFTVLTPALSHMDGEPPQLVAAGSDVQLAPAADPYIIMSSRQAAIKLLETA